MAGKVDGDTAISPELEAWHTAPGEQGAVLTLMTSYPSVRAVVRARCFSCVRRRATAGPSDPGHPSFPPGTRIVLDPGHGGRDPGALGSVVEKQVTLDVALRVRALLQAAGARVTLTRETDTQLNLSKTLDLQARAAQATPTVSAFVSIHANAARPERLLFGYGVESHWVPNISKSSGLADALRQSLVGWTGAYSCGVKHDQDLSVLRNARVPAALVEISFVSHPVEGLNLQQSDSLDRVALGLTWGLHNFLLPEAVQIGPSLPVGGVPGS